MSRASSRFSLPAPIAAKLRSVQRRMTGIGVATAVVVGASVLMGAMLVAMAVDYMATLYDSAWRFALTAAALSAAIITLGGWAILAWRRASRLEHVAREVDRHVPHLEERWSTVTHFARSADPTATPESSLEDQRGAVHPAMFRQVADEAAKGDSYVDAEDVVSLSAIVKSFLVLNAVTLVLVLAWIADWQRTNVLLSRFWSPSSSISATQLLAIPGDTVVGRGEPVMISASLSGAPIDEATLMIRREGDEEEQFSLITRADDPTSINHRFRSVDESFAYRIRGGDGQTPWHKITAADRPTIAEVQLSITPPEYRKEPTQRHKKLPRRLSAVEGSQFELAIRSQGPLKSLRLMLGGDESGGNREFVDLQASEDGWYRYRAELSKSLVLTPILTEPHGLAIRRPPTTRLHVYPDRAPVVRIISPNDHVAVTPNDTIEIDFVAEDDNGIAAAELVVLQDPIEPDGEPIELEVMPIDLGEAEGQKRVRSSARLDLNDYPLVDGASLQYAIRVVEQRSPSVADQATERQIAGNGNEQAKQTPQVSPTADESDSPDAPDSRSIATADAPSPNQPQTADSSNSKVGGGEQQSDRTEMASVDRAKEQSPSQGSSSQALAGDSSEPRDPSNTESQPAEASETTPMVAMSETPTNEEPTSAQQGNGLASQAGRQASGESRQTAAGGSQGETRTASASVGNSTEQSSDPEDTAQTANSIAIANDDSAESGEETTSNRTAESQARILVAATPEETEPDSEAETGGNPADQMSQEENAPSGAIAQTNPSADGSSAQEDATDSEPSDTEPESSQPIASSGSSSQNGKPSGSSRAGDRMTRRMLDVGAQSSTSNSMRVQVDRYAGSFEGQQRAKLEIAIAPELEAITNYLVRAQKLSRSVLDETGDNEGWQARHQRDVGLADSTLKKAQEVARKLQGRTHNTPYAFIGLQISDISAANVTPAREAFWNALQKEGDQRVSRVRQGWQQVTQALDRIAQLSQRFETAKKEFALADATQRIKQMYRIFVEDTFATPLRGNRDGGSKFSRQAVEFELDEDYLKRLREVLEMRRELRAELAKILAEDPRLLRRFMNNFREGQLNLRNQLTELHELQDALARETLVWSAAEESKRDAAMAVLLRRRLEETEGLAMETGKMADRFEAWLPLDRDQLNGELKAGLEEANALAADARELALHATRVAGKPTDERDLTLLLSESLALYERLREFEVVIRRLGADPGSGAEIEFVLNRLAETRALVTKVSSWNRRMRGLDAGKFHRAAAVEQYELATATDVLAGQLGNLEGVLAGLLQTGDTLPSELAEQSRALLATLDQEVTPNQMAAAIALERELWPRVAARQQAASAALEKAEEQFDSLIKAAIEELDKLPVQDPIAQLEEDPTLDEILAELEREGVLEAALGIPLRPSNLQIISDWLRPSQGGVSIGSRAYGMAARQMRGEAQRMNRAARLAQQRALERIRANRQVVKYAKPRDTEEGRAATEWNVLISQLEDDLLQGRDKLPPERYRTAIQQYRTIINKVASERLEQP